MFTAILFVSMLASPATSDYRAPAATEPHATVELRETYANRPVGTLTRTVSIDGKSIGSQESVAVEPGSHTFVVRAEFTTSTKSTEQKTVASTIRMSRPCGFFHNKTCFEDVPVTRTMTVPTTVVTPVASCEAELKQDAAAGARVSLEYTFHSATSCELKASSVLPAPVAAKATPTSAAKSASAKSATAKKSKKH